MPEEITQLETIRSGRLNALTPPQEDLPRVLRQMLKGRQPGEGLERQAHGDLGGEMRRCLADEAALFDGAA